MTTAGVPGWPRSWSPRSRKPTPGPEAELLEAALSCSGWPAAAPVVFREPQMPTGFPDLVAVVLREQALLLNATRWCLREEHLRLLHHVYAVRRTTEDQISALLRLKPARLSALLGDLEDSQLVRRRSQRVSSRALADIFVARRIIAVEAKIRDWRGALAQAIANTWFASHSYILLPAKSWRTTVAEHASSHGIGVIIFDGRTTSVALRARGHPIPASYGSWLVNEWSVRQLGRSWDE